MLALTLVVELILYVAVGFFLQKRQQHGTVFEVRGVEAELEGVKNEAGQKDVRVNHRQLPVEILPHHMALLEKKTQRHIKNPLPHQGQRQQPPSASLSAF